MDLDQDSYCGHKLRGRTEIQSLFLGDHGTYTADISAQEVTRVEVCPDL